ncbi:M28 family peptidase [Burkholderia gladioli]|uniref:M28 family peptidase n=1 Tax=Burkholderia gladioli TaxID=28095 RepID=UPI00163F5D94|nr:M28 family peptidase [Burkholderia gladioli]
MFSETQVDQNLPPVQADEYEALLVSFNMLCGFGGRLLGTESERRAVEWIFAQFEQMSGEATLHPVETTVWRPTRATLTIGSSGETFPCQPMLHTVSTPHEGMIGRIVDMGRGRSEDYERLGDSARGNIVLVEHEYPFSTTHLHRRDKIRLAIRHGARALLMSNPTGDGGLLSGSSGEEKGFDPIPCGYITRECALRLRSLDSSEAEICLDLDGVSEPVVSGNASVVIGDPALPRIVISAHIDGHPLGESALDNASGVAVAVAATRHLEPLFRDNPAFALQTIIFTAEEWALYGSEDYLRNLPEEQRDRLLLNVNLDTVGGSSKLTALISEFPKLERLIRMASESSGVDVDTSLPLRANSDHYNFARVGVPAFRLLAGFDEPESRVQHILSGGDTRDKVFPEELRTALAYVCALIRTAIANPSILSSLR